MATNDALIAEAQEIATELGIEVTTEGLTNALLVDLVSDLKAKKTDAEKQTAADGAPPAETPPEEPPAETPAAEPPAETPAAEPPAETPAAEPPAETPAAEPPAETPPEEVWCEYRGWISAEAAGDAEALAAAKAAAAEEALPVRDAKGKKYFVEPGRSITTQVGILSDNDEIPADVVAIIGKDTLAAHVKSGALYRGK